MDVVRKVCLRWRPKSLCFRRTGTFYRVTLCIFGSGIETTVCTPTSSLSRIKINPGSYFCTSSYFCASNQVNRRGKLLQRFINSAGNTKKKKRWYDSNEQKSRGDGSLTWNTKPANNQRMNVFNAILMEAITDIMSTGEINNKLHGHGIEVLGVKVSPDLGNIIVYWTSSTPNLATAEELLNSNAGKIRGELASLSILTSIPRITFVKDLTSTKILEVQNLLAEADFGPDFQPTSLIHPFKLDAVSKKQPAFSSGSDKTLYQEPKASDTQLPWAPPEMKHNIFGLDHKALMNQVAQKVAKTRSKDQRSSFASLDTKPVQQDQWHLDDKSFFKGFDFQVDSGVVKNNFTLETDFENFSNVLPTPKKYKKEKRLPKMNNKICLQRIC
ncbi:putative ribosome-binding factor A, mitochondrial [Limulus polyphemus]|uniref:Ribosome-binding factor A, mitochondrial n=1 Tax=Limulus polyphemus TaxID=6850 RepID=A0ABM1BNC3_LIMPO|nr:putative ribosome-binding factor A, mitochondrial [Limulus polyphemus]